MLVDYKLARTTKSKFLSDKPASVITEQLEAEEDKDVVRQDLTEHKKNKYNNQRIRSSSTAHQHILDYLLRYSDVEDTK